MEKYNAEHEMQRKWLEIANGPKFKELRSRLKEAESKADCYQRLRENAQSQSEDIIQRLRAAEAQLDAVSKERDECRQGEIDRLKCMLEDERDDNKRLREALERIANSYTDSDLTFEHSARIRLINIAKQAIDAAMEGGTE